MKDYTIEAYGAIGTFVLIAAVIITDFILWSRLKQSRVVTRSYIELCLQGDVNRKAIIKILDKMCLEYEKALDDSHTTYRLESYIRAYLRKVLFGVKNIDELWEIIGDYAPSRSDGKFVDDQIITVFSNNERRLVELFDQGFPYGKSDIPPFASKLTHRYFAKNDVRAHFYERLKRFEKVI